MITLSIDGSTKATGIAIFQDTTLVKYDCIYAKDNDTIDRILKMANEIKNICIKYKVNQVCMEEVLPEDVKHNDKVYTSLKYLQAAVVFVLHSLGLRYEFKTASWWRSRCGIRTGRGIKREELKLASIAFVRDEYNIQVTDDIADAIGLGFAYVGAGPKPDCYDWS